MSTNGEQKKAFPIMLALVGAAVLVLGCMGVACGGVGWWIWTKAAKEREEAKNTGTADKTPGPSRLEKLQDANNLKQLGLAMLDYHDTYKSFPSPKTQQLSWRVAILPYVEQGPLYTQFHLDEPWHSVHNKKIFDTYPMPDVFRSPRDRGKDVRKTYYQVVTGPKTIWPEPTAKATMQSITDGTSNTFMIVEAKTPLFWTQPEDIVFNGRDLPPLGGIFDGDFNACFADASTRWIARNRVSDVTLKGLITATGGEFLQPGGWDEWDFGDK
jgi:hypothetical protein